MLLLELFDENTIDVPSEIREILLDILTPMVASNVPFVTVDSIIDKINEYRLGLDIDANFVMTILNPNDNQMIEKIDGEKIYFKVSSPLDVAKSDEKEEKDTEHVSKMAQKQADKAIKNK